MYKTHDKAASLDASMVVTVSRVGSTFVPGGRAAHRRQEPTTQGSHAERAGKRPSRIPTLGQDWMKEPLAAFV